MFVDFDLFREGETISTQFQGVRFLEAPKIALAAVTGNFDKKVLCNVQPGEEFKGAPLSIEFFRPQAYVRLHARHMERFAFSIRATLRAFDAYGKLLAQDGPVTIGPEPIPMEIEMASPCIERIELHYTGSYTEVIEDLEFSPSRLNGALCGQDSAIHTTERLAVLA